MIKDKIFPLFGEWKALEDSYKDNFGKGIFENFNLVLGEDLDALVAKIDGYLTNLLFYRTIEEVRIPFFLEAEGCYINTNLYSNAQLRALMRSLKQLNNIRGTILSYEVMFRWLGFETVQVIEDFNIYTFDSPLTLDSDIRPTFDTGDKCKGCIRYDLVLTGNVPLTPLLYDQIKDVLAYLEPIDAKLRKITYNGFDITNGQFLFFHINSDGRLIFTTLNPDWGGSFELVGVNLVVNLPAELAAFWSFEITPFATLKLNII